MKKGQVSVEYMVMLTATITILLLIAILMVRFITEARVNEIPVSEDELACNVGGGGVVSTTVGTRTIEQYVEIKVKLHGYFQPYDGSVDTAPARVMWNNREFIPEPALVACPNTGMEICELQDRYQLNFSQPGGRDGFYLRTSTLGQCFNYSALTSGPGPGPPGTIPVDVIDMAGNINAGPRTCLGVGEDVEGQVDADQIHMEFDIDTALAAAIPPKNRNDITGINLMINETACFPPNCGPNDLTVGQIQANEYSLSPQADMTNFQEYNLIPTPPTREWVTLSLPNTLVTNVSSPASAGQNLYIAVNKTSGLGFYYICACNNCPSPSTPYLELTVA
jgi:hypothetical protein